MGYRVNSYADENLDAQPKPRSDHPDQESVISCSDSAPDQYKCSITHDLMKDPVMCADGHTYERHAIEEWLSLKDTIPITNQTLVNKNLIPVHGMRQLIQDYKDKLKKVR